MKAWRTYECQLCGIEWEVEGRRELGRWWPLDQDNLFCTDCGLEGRWQGSMEAVTQRRLLAMGRGG